MSQASNHVKWCLNKAKKEIEECKKVGKREEHRGLIKKSPDLEEAKKHLLKAEHNLKAIKTFNDTGFSDWSINAGFYCIYQCFLGIAIKFGYESGNQECTISLIEWLNEDKKINIDNRFIELLKHENLKDIEINKIIDMREEYTYGVKTSVEDDNKINELLELCKICLDQTKNIIFKE